MTEIRFYHLQRKTLDQALPEILQKALAGERKVVVRAPDQQETERLNDHLWTFRPDVFLPHGSAKDGNPDLQPIWLTDKEENPNGADVLIVTGGAAYDNAEEFSLCCEMLDGNDETQTAAARKRWKLYKEAGHTISYWQQSESGGWENKA